MICWKCGYQAEYFSLKEYHSRLRIVCPECGVPWSVTDTERAELSKVRGVSSVLDTSGDIVAPGLEGATR